MPLVKNLSIISPNNSHCPFTDHYSRGLVYSLTVALLYKKTLLYGYRILHCGDWVRVVDFPPIFSKDTPSVTSYLCLILHHRDWVYLVDFAPVFSRDTHSVTSCLLYCPPRPLWNGVYFKRKEIAPLGSKFFPFRVDLFRKGANALDRITPPLDVYSFASLGMPACQ